MVWTVRSATNRHELHRLQHEDLERGHTINTSKGQKHTQKERQGHYEQDRVCEGHMSIAQIPCC